MRLSKKHIMLLSLLLLVFLFWAGEGKDLTAVQSDLYYQKGINEGYAFIPVYKDNLSHFKKCSRYHAYVYRDAGIAIKSKTDFKILGKKRDNICKLKKVYTEKTFFVIPNFWAKNVVTCYVPMKKMEQLASLYEQVWNDSYLLSDYSKKLGVTKVFGVEFELSSIWADIEDNYCDVNYPFNKEYSSKRKIKKEDIKPVRKTFFSS